MMVFPPGRWRGEHAIHLGALLRAPPERRRLAAASRQPPFPASALRCPRPPRSPEGSTVCRSGGWRKPLSARYRVVLSPSRESALRRWAATVLNMCSDRWRLHSLPVGSPSRSPTVLGANQEDNKHLPMVWSFSESLTDLEAAALCISGLLQQPVGRAVRADDGDLRRHPELALEHLRRCPHGRQVPVGAFGVVMHRSGDARLGESRNCECDSLFGSRLVLSNRMGRGPRFDNCCALPDAQVTPSQMRM